MPIRLGHGSYCREVANDFHGDVEVGRWTGIAPRCLFLTGRGVTHPSVVNRRAVSNFPFLDLLGWDYTRNGGESPPIRLGSDVWVGEAAVFLPGVAVGDGAVVGAGAVVSRDVPPYAVAAGNPARVVRYRFPAEQVAALLRVRWWDWPDERLRDCTPLMKDVDAFLAAHDPLHGRLREVCAESRSGRPGADGGEADRAGGLADLLRRLPPLGAVAEVGYGPGVSTEVFCLFARQVLAVGADGGVPAPAALARLGRYPNVEFAGGPSPEAAWRVPDGSLDLAYLGAPAGYERAVAGLLAWRPKVRRGGWLAGHGYAHEPAPAAAAARAVDDLVGRPDAVFRDTSWLRQRP